MSPAEILELADRLWASSNNENVIKAYKVLRVCADVVTVATRLARRIDDAEADAALAKLDAIAP